MNDRKSLLEKIEKIDFFSNENKKLFKNLLLRSEDLSDFEKIKLNQFFEGLFYYDKPKKKQAYIIKNNSVYDENNNFLYNLK